jgi:SSS family solute:Na+ symporter
VISLLQGNKDQPGSVDLGDIDFSTTRGFNVAGIAVALILAALYATWW